MDKSPPKVVDNVTLKAPNATDIAGQRMDSYRFSMANLEGIRFIFFIIYVDEILIIKCYARSPYNTLFNFNFQTLKMLI